MREPSERQRRSEHRESWELLPWLVNDSLNDAQVLRLQEHLCQCALCRREYEELLLLREQIQREESVLYTPHEPLRRLMTRIEHDEIAPRVEPGSATAPHIVQRMKWLTFAVAAEALGLVILVGALSWPFDWQANDERAEPRYATLSSASPLPREAAARVVFAASISLTELGELLRSCNAQIVAGPSDAGVYTLAFPAAHDQKEVATAIDRLRAQPEVRFAELVVTDVGAWN